MYFSFNGTATTEIYPYCHTRSLHDALPIYDREVVDDLVHAPVHRGGEADRELRREQHLAEGVGHRQPQELQVVLGEDALDLDRSEEHTSELQSLMRLSYAVLCLK